MPTGTVKQFNAAKGYGFIIGDDGGPDVFVHHSNIIMRGFRRLNEKERVNYQLSPGNKPGTVQAIDVKVIG